MDNATALRVAFIRAQGKRSLAARAVGQPGDLYRAWRRPRGAAPLAGLHVRLASLDGLPCVSFAVAGSEATRCDTNKKRQPHPARRQA